MNPLQLPLLVGQNYIISYNHCYKWLVINKRTKMLNQNDRYEGYIVGWDGIIAVRDVEYDVTGRCLSNHSAANYDIIGEVDKSYVELSAYLKTLYKTILNAPGKSIFTLYIGPNDPLDGLLASNRFLVRPISGINTYFGKHKFEGSFQLFDIEFNLYKNTDYHGSSQLTIEDSSLMNPCIPTTDLLSELQYNLQLVSSIGGGGGGAAGNNQIVQFKVSSVPSWAVSIPAGLSIDMSKMGIPPEQYRGFCEHEWVNISFYEYGPNVKHACKKCGKSKDEK